jgi:MFS family permease
MLLQLLGGMMLSPHRTFFPIYVQELGYSSLQISTLSTARLMMAMLASLLGGTLCDSLGRKWTLLIGNLGFVLGSLLFLTPSLWWIAVLWALSGIGMGLRTLGSQSYLMDVAAPTYFGVLTALYNWGYTLGGALSSPVVGVLLERWDYGMFGGLMGLLAVGTVLVNGLLLPRSSAEIERGRIARRLLFGYGGLVRRRSVVLLALLRFLPTVYWGMALIFVPLLLDAAGANKTTIALYATLSQVIASLAQVIVGRAIDRVGSKWPTVITFLILVTGILGTGLLFRHLWAVFVFGTVGDAAAWSLSTLLPSLVARVASAEERGRVLGWVHLWWNVAMILGSLLGGALFDRWMGLPFMIAGMLNLLSIALTFSFFRLFRQGRSMLGAP